MLEITVKKTSDQYSTYITLIFKESYSLTLSKDNIKIEIPSLYRPVFSFKWSLAGRYKIYKPQWYILKKAIFNKTNYEITFNNTDGYHSIKIENNAVILQMWADEYGEIHYRIPIEENTNTLLTMLDQIADNYPDEPLPKIFNYGLEDFPVYLSSFNTNTNLITIKLFYNYNQYTRIPLSKTDVLLILSWLNDNTVELPTQIKSDNGKLTFATWDGIWRGSYSVEICDKFKTALTKAVNL